MSKRLALIAAGLVAGFAAGVAWIRPAAVEGPDGPLPPARHEHRDVTFRALLIAGILMFVALAGMVGLAAWIFPGSLRDNSVPDVSARFPAPQLQPSPATDMEAFRTRQLQQLNSFYWLDRGAKRLHIPITQAMEDVARQGIADWPTK